MRSREHDPHGHSLQGAGGDAGGHWDRDWRPGVEANCQAPHTELVSQPNKTVNITDLKPLFRGGGIDFGPYN